MGSNNRVTRQIKFGVDSAAEVPRKFNTTRVTTNNGISFASSSVKEDDVVLKDLLKMDSVGSLSARFGFTGSVTRLGQSCETPLRESGSCQYIGAEQCRPVLSAIIKHGVTKSLLRYLLAAIRSPCGFEGHDLTLCCAETITTSTTPTTSTTSTTETTSTSPETTSTTTTTT